METNCKCLLLMKIGKEEFMYDLMKKGIVFMNTTEYFRDHPNYEIGDSFEGAAIVQNGTVVEWRKDLDKEKLYCMWQINNVMPFECDSAEYDEKTNKHYVFFKLSKYCGFADNSFVVVIRNIKEFNRRIEVACERKGLTVERQIVHYYDKSSYKPKKVCPFMKRKQYSHQQEVRYLVHTDSSKPLTLEIGSIEDIAIKYTAKSMMKLLVKIDENDKTEL